MARTGGKLEKQNQPAPQGRAEGPKALEVRMDLYNHYYENLGQRSLERASFHVLLDILAEIKELKKAQNNGRVPVPAVPGAGNHTAPEHIANTYRGPGRPRRSP